MYVCMYVYEINRNTTAYMICYLFPYAFSGYLYDVCMYIQQYYVTVYVDIYMDAGDTSSPLILKLKVKNTIR